MHIDDNLSVVSKAGVVHYKSWKWVIMKYEDVPIKVLSFYARKLFAGDWDSHKFAGIKVDAPWNQVFTVRKITELFGVCTS